jgi:hypothetical protein
MIWLRNLLAVIGVLTVIFLLTSETSSKGSVELLVGKESKPTSVGQAATTVKSGLVILPVDSP